MTENQQAEKTQHDHNRYLFTTVIPGDPEAAQYLSDCAYGKLATWLNAHEEGLKHRTTQWNAAGVSHVARGLGLNLTTNGIKRVLARKGRLTPQQILNHVRTLDKKHDNATTAKILNEEGVPYYGRTAPTTWAAKVVNDYLRHAANREKEGKPAVGTKTRRYLKEPKPSKRGKKIIQDLFTDSYPQPEPEMTQTKVLASSKVERNLNGNEISCSYVVREGVVEISLRYVGAPTSDEALGLRTLLEQLKIYVG